MKKKTIRFTIPMLMLLTVLMSSFMIAHAAQIEPRYTGLSQLSSALSISSSGAAKCNGTAVVRSGYTVSLTVELKQDGTSIKEWTSSGSGTVSTDGTYYVMSGHNYVVTTTAEVRDSKGNVVETPSKDSVVTSYK